MALEGSNDMDMLKSLSAKTYVDQATWVLNGYWEDWAQAEAEHVWEFAHRIIELDEKNGKEGREVDEFTAHRFLESFEETLTVRELREILKKIDIDTNKMVSLAEYLIYKFSIDWHHLVHSPQGDNKDEIDKAMAMVAEAQAALQEAQESERQATQRALEARSAADEARRRQEEATAAQAEAEVKASEAAEAAGASRQAEEAMMAAEAELKAALAELQAQEDAYNAKVADLEARSESGGIVSRGRAKNELEQLKSEDPLPLRRAKITQGSAVKRQEKATQAAADARKASEAAAVVADEALESANLAKRESDIAAAKAQEAKLASEQAKEAAAEALARAEESFKSAAEFLEEAKLKVGDAQGAIWWMEREMEEARKYMPQARGGVAK